MKLDKLTTLTSTQICDLTYKFTQAFDYFKISISKGD